MIVSRANQGVISTPHIQEYPDLIIYLPVMILSWNIWGGRLGQYTSIFKE